MPERISILELEGLALNGLVREARIVDCSKVKGIRYSKIVAELSDGRIVETTCDFYSRIIKTYLTLIRYKDLGKTIVIKELSEEMMSGITYDLDLGDKRND